MAKGKNKKILVTGATGQQGGAAVPGLLEHGHHVRIMTRNPEKMKSIRNPNIAVVQGDFRNRESLKKALSGVDGAFVMGTPYEEGPKAEVNQGKAIIDACVEEDIGHVVYSSVCCADKKTGIPHFDSKYEVEKHLKKTGIPYTILRPVWFMENFASPWYLPSIEKGILSTPLHPRRQLQMVSVADIGKIVADAFTNPSRYLGKEFDIAGDEMNMERIVKEISNVLFRRIEYVHIPESRAEETLGEDWALMFKWFNDHGYDVDVEGTRNRFEYYGIPLTSFRQYLGATRLGIDVAA
jgi:uncharacterized protein YbjT (DUF2867 family)